MAGVAAQAVVEGLEGGVVVAALAAVQAALVAQEVEDTPQLQTRKGLSLSLMPVCTVARRMTLQTWCATRPKHSGSKLN